MKKEASFALPPEELEEKELRCIVDALVAHAELYVVKSKDHEIDLSLTKEACIK
ncbi:hypothetical protein KIN20_021173 [Parelaphostrongylus tenuis]|uniref:Uncharacterized protein n=1 Tax=Parelaphostrongylus tenuis TaxID=148309 RepID=A0AAD5MSB6_PARTN|nr:hypothetical protein KIN20_021173 [Parelaphostrongylus tenuis]